MGPEEFVVVVVGDDDRAGPGQAGGRLFGPLDDVGVYRYSGQNCNIGRNGTATFNTGPGSIFFLVVGNDGVAVEGSYGWDGDGTERPEDLDDPSCAYTRDFTFRCD